MSNNATAAMTPPSLNQHGSTPAAALGVAEIALTESRTMRAATIDRTDVLDRVGGLAMLPDDMHATTDGVASFYEVPVSTIESVVEGNKVELEFNGRRVLKGAELREFAAPFGGVAKLGLHHNTRSLAVFSRRAILNVGQLLTESTVARQVRTYLLEVEVIASSGQKTAALAQTKAPAGDDLDLLEGMVRAMRADRQRLAAVEQATAVTAAKVAAIEGRHEWFTALGYALLHDHDTERSYLSQVGRKATSVMREQGAEPHQRQDATFGKVNVYPVSVLEIAFAEVSR